MAKTLELRSITVYLTKGEKKTFLLGKHGVVGMKADPVNPLKIVEIYYEDTMESFKGFNFTTMADLKEQVLELPKSPILLPRNK